MIAVEALVWTFCCHQAPEAPACVFVAVSGCAFVFIALRRREVGVVENQRWRSSPLLLLLRLARCGWRRLPGSGTLRRLLYSLRENARLHQAKGWPAEALELWVLFTSLLLVFLPAFLSRAVLTRVIGVIWPGAS